MTMRLKNTGSYTLVPIKFMKSNPLFTASLVLTICLSTLVFSCKTKKPADNQVKQEEIENETNTIGNVQVVKVEALPNVPQINQPVADTAKCSMLISFYSRGAGSDYEVIAEFERFISDYGVSGKNVPTFERIRWGREGEIDYCIQWKDLAPEEKSKFTEQVNLILKKSKLVHVSYNATCAHRR